MDVSTSTTSAPAPGAKNLRPPWEPGKSGNPSGSSRKARQRGELRHVVEKARIHTDEMLTVLRNLAKGLGFDERALEVTPELREVCAKDVLAYAWGPAQDQPVPQRLLLDDMHDEQPGGSSVDRVDDMPEVTP